MERENYYHKPQVNLNWYWTPSPRLILSNVFYFSHGKGGGTGRLGANPGQRADGSIDWERAADELNSLTAAEADPDLVDAGEVGESEIAAQTVLRNSVNHHFWYGYLGTAEYRLNTSFTLALGADLRYYKGQHWRELRNLLGADYFLYEWDANAATPVKRLGDKVSYHNDGLTRWGGGFAQLEGRFGKLTAFSSTSGSITGYQRIDYFRPKVDGEWDRTGWANFSGCTVKVGGNYNLTRAVNLYANAGWLSTAPKFDSVYHYDNSRYDPALNEKVASFEAGAGYLERGRFTGNANLYYTRWMDRSWPKSIYSDKLDQSFRFLLNGIDALHKGVELDLKARLHSMLELRGMVSLGDWEWLNDVDVTFSPEEDPDAVGNFQVYAGGLKVGDAAQKTLALSAALFPAPGLYASLGLRRFMDHYARFDPANRTDSGDRRQSLATAGLQPRRPARQLSVAPRSLRRRQGEAAAARLQPARRAVRFRRGRRGRARRGERPRLPRAAAALEHLVVVRVLRGRALPALRAGGNQSPWTASNWHGVGEPGCPVERPGVDTSPETVMIRVRN